VWSQTDSDRRHQSGIVERRFLVGLGWEKGLRHVFSGELINGSGVATGQVSYRINILIIDVGAGALGE
jgi:hypothetical protein